MTEEEFKVICKFYLTVLSARAAHYCYFNFKRNSVVLCNSTTRSDAQHGDRLMDFSVGELGIHLVEFHDKKIIPTLKRMLRIPDNKFYYIHVVNFMKEWSKCPFNELLVNIGSEGQLYINEKLCGMVIENFHVIMMINRYIDIMDDVVKKDNIVETTVDIHPKMTGNYYMISVDTTMFERNGVKTFNNVLPKMYIPCIDGLSTISLKSFLPKVKQDYVLKRYFWNEDIRIYSMTYYSDDNAMVKSFRPNILSIPISNITSMNVEEN